VVGCGDEPAHAGGKNSVQLILADANDKPVTDLGNTLKAGVPGSGRRNLISRGHHRVTGRGRA
jgi:hypothetical protein